MEFKGTQGDLKLVYSSGICIGIEVELGTGYAQVTANTILPDTDEEYEKEKEKILANMQLYATAPKMLALLQKISSKKTFHQGDFTEIKEMIAEATTIPK